MIDEKNKNCPGTCGGESKFDGFVESIEEEIRNENWQRLWDKYGKFVTYASCAILLGVGVYGMWQKQDLSDREAISSRFTVVQSALMSGQIDAAISEIKALSTVSKKDYATLAKFEYAGALRAKKDQLALSEYKMIFEDKDVNKMLRDLSYIFYVSSAIDLMSTKDILANIDSFIKNLSENYVGQTWDLLAKETLAFCHMKAGNNDLAKSTLESLAKTTGIPDNMAERARVLIHSIGQK